MQSKQVAGEDLHLTYGLFLHGLDNRPRWFHFFGTKSQLSHDRQPLTVDIPVNLYLRLPIPATATCYLITSATKATKATKGYAAC